MRPTSFGLTPEYMEYVHEQMFYLILHGNWNYYDVYNLPVKVRAWFVQRLSKHFEDKNKEEEKAMRKLNKK